MDANASNQDNNALYRITTTSFNRLAIIALIASISFGCGKKDDAAAQQQVPPMPVTVITLEPTSVPISAEAVSQTEGAKEVEIRPRVGGIVLK